MSIEKLQQEIERDTNTLAMERAEFTEYQQRIGIRIERQKKLLDYREKEIAEKQERLKQEVIQEQIHNKAIEG